VKTVALKVDDRTVDSRQTTLQPGEQSHIRLQASVPDAKAHRWQVGDFPEWPYATCRNVPGRFFLGRDHVRIEAAGRYLVPDDLAAVYFRAVEGDFDVKARCLSQTESTGENAAVGLVIRNNLSDPQSGGLAIHYRIPKYGGYKVCQFDRDGDGKFDARLDGGHVRFPFWMKYEKRGKMIQSLTSENAHDWLPCGIPIEMPSAAAVQDVGVYANASSAEGETGVAEFSDLTIQRVGP
jgi:hypothetical protein